MDNHERQLNAKLRALANDDRLLNVSAQTEQAVMARWEAEHRVRATPTHWLRSRTGQTVSWISGAAAAVVLVAGMTSMRRPEEPLTAPAAEMADVTSDRLTLTDEHSDVDVFFPLGPLSPRELNGSSLQLMRVQFRGAALSRLGVVVDGALASEVIEADVLFGEDGMARAIRFER